MNHFVGLLIISTCIATAFAFLNRSDRKERLKYFFTLMTYMVFGSLAFSWVMYFIPW